jgi:predicted patatin/cPLA2 family phospholipase
MKRKLAIITSGGGMTCSYTAGVIYALVKEYKITTPDIVITGSGSAGTLAYYSAGQYESINNIWTNLLDKKDFINPLRVWKIIDIDYLIDEVFKKQEPLDIINLRKSPIKFFASATNYTTGELKYFSNRDSVDFFEILRATKAMPIAYNKPILIEGNRYCDTFKSSSPYVHIKKAIEENLTDIILIDTTTKENLNTKLFFNTWLRFKNKKFKENYYDIKKKNTFEVNIYTITPKKPLQITTLNNNSKLLKKTFSQGYKEIQEDKGFAEFIRKYKM